jgi:hypothetical protein
MSKRGFGEGLWCVSGDFNSVRDGTERRGINSIVDNGSNSDMRGFDNFLGDLDMIDLPLVGRQFTWLHPN